eukprot:TRINITY_DN2743_c0_g1_i1.p1 TRINITY_DN2743_c0_g1~~TRINITY_DN2743_c0_g1_i1.p1  ORF type:complete len:263 (-),score=51.63 TRINITY_DN2743_c0_g1_i1:115-903(-)
MELLDSKREDIMKKLAEVTEECFKLLRFQAAKLEIYEHTDKWAVQLPNKDLLALCSYFKSRYELVKNIIDNTAKLEKEALPKLELKIKYSESYINNLIKEAKDYKPPNITTKQVQYITSIDEEIMETLQTVKGILLEESFNETPAKNSTKASKNKELSITPKATPGDKSSFSKKVNAKKPPISKRSSSAMAHKKENKRQKLILQETGNKDERQEKSTPNTGNEYELSMFSNMQSLRKLKKKSHKSAKQSLEDSFREGLNGKD